MAIDNDKSYELTGAQVKDLANKIKAKAADNIFVGATSAAPGSKGLVPQPQAGDNTKFLSGDGTWKSVSSGGATKHEITIWGASGEFSLCPNPYVDYSNRPQIADPFGNGIYPTQLAEWALNGDEFWIVPGEGDVYYHRSTPIKATVSVAVDSAYEPGTTPLPEQIVNLMISYTVADSFATQTYPRVPTEFTVILDVDDMNMNEYNVTVFQGNTLPFFFVYGNSANFQWSYLAAASMVQGVLPGSVAWSGVVREYYGDLANPQHLRRALSALYSGKTISMTAMREVDGMLVPLAGITFDRFLLENVNGTPIPTEVSISDLADAIGNYNVRLYLYGASTQSQGLVVQVFGDSVQANGN